jgi:hypothetical protein
MTMYSVYSVLLLGSPFEEPSEEEEEEEESPATYSVYWARRLRSRLIFLDSPRRGRMKKAEGQQTSGRFTLGVFQVSDEH